MGLQSLCGRVTVGFSVSLLLFVVSFCYADDKTIQVVGIGECADCTDRNIKTAHAFSGLRVTIDCKVENGEIKTRGEGELDKYGKFKVSLPQEMMKNGKLKEACYAQLHSASAAPCPTHNGTEASKIVVIKSESDEGKHTLKPAGNLKFSTPLCTSAFLWPKYKYPPLPKLPPFFKIHPWKKHFPIYKKPLPPYIPIYKKPLPPYKPIYKKPLPPLVPIYKPKPAFYKKPYHPLIPKVFVHPKFPPFSKIPPKYFHHHHPLFPPLPPFIPHP